MPKLQRQVLVLMCFIAAFVWLAILQFPDNNLHIYACDVGQGDGLLLTHGFNQVVIDGGPNNNLLTCLGDHMPFWDRKIEMVILTNQDKDHFFGLTEVVKRFEVEAFVATSYDKQGVEFAKLKQAVKDRGTKVITPTVGDIFRLSNLSFEILWPESPTGNVLGAVDPSESVNEVSLVFLLKYNDFDALFTGDIVPQSIEPMLELGKVSDVEYLKVPHHGSKNGLTQSLLEKSSPEIAVVSVGLNNRYGHPDGEVIKLLNDKSIQTLRTDRMGEVEVITDGQKWWVRK